MKRIIVFLAALAMVAGSLWATEFSKVSDVVMQMDGSTGTAALDDQVMVAVAKGIDMSIASRVVLDAQGGLPLSFVLTDAAFDTFAQNTMVRFTAWLIASYNGKSQTFGLAVTAKDIKSALKAIPSMVDDQLRYDLLDILPIVTDDLTFDYAWKGSLSSWVDGQGVKKGQRYVVTAADGTSEALLVVRDVLPYLSRTVATYAPIYVGDVQPGLPMAKGPMWTSVLSVPFSVNGNGFGIDLSMMRSMSITPWAPIFRVGAWVEMANGLRTYTATQATFSAGMQVEYSLGTLFDTSFTLLRDGAVGAAVMAGVGVRIPSSDPTFIFGGTWEGWYHHTPSVHWGWGIHMGGSYWAQVSNSTVSEARNVLFQIGPVVILNW